MAFLVTPWVLHIRERLESDELNSYEERGSNLAYIEDSGNISSRLRYHEYISGEAALFA